MKLKRFSMGRIITASGLFLKAVQVLLSSLGVKAASGTAAILAVTCIIVGGLVVYALETRGAASVFAVVSAVLVLLGILMPEMSAAAFIAAYYGVFVFFALMLAAGSRRGRAFAAAVAVLAAAALLHTVGVISLPAPAVTVLLIIAYTVMGVALFF